MKPKIELEFADDINIESFMDICKSIWKEHKWAIKSINVNSGVEK